MTRSDNTTRTSPTPMKAPLPQSSRSPVSSIACAGILPGLAGWAWFQNTVVSLPIDLTSPVALGAAAIIVIEAVVILKQSVDLSQLRRRAQASVDDEGNLAALYSKALTGSLDRFSVGEVLQFLNSIRETGILDVVGVDGSTVHRLLLQDGDIIDAYDGDQRGERAVAEVLQCQDGTFTFIRGDLPSDERVIQKPTMTLLMEAYQVRDESGGGQELELGEGPMFAGASS